MPEVSASLAELRRRRAWQPDYAAQTKLCPRCHGRLRLTAQAGYLGGQVRVWSFHASWWYVCSGCDWIVSPDLFVPQEVAV